MSTDNPGTKWPANLRWSLYLLVGAVLIIGGLVVLVAGAWIGGPIIIAGILVMTAGLAEWDAPKTTKRRTAAVNDSDSQ